MMRIFINLSIVITLILCSTKVMSQINEIEHFTDSSINRFDNLTLSVQVADGIVYTGKVQESSSSMIPFISKVDTAGNVIWSTLNINSIRLSRFFWKDLIDGDDGFIYAVNQETDFNINRDNVIWKVNIKTGEILFRNALTMSGLSIKISNYDSTYFLCAFEQSGFSGASSYLALLNKTTGDTVKTKFEQNGTQYRFDVAADKFGNVIHCFGNVVKKYNGNNFDQVLWEKNYDNGPSIDLLKVEEIYVDDYNDLYLIGLGGNVFSRWDNNGVIKKIDINTGDEIWGTNVTQSLNSMTLSDFKDANGFLYLSYAHATVGSVSYRFYVGKVNKQSGNVAVSGTHFIAPGAASSNGAFQQANSIAVDCNGDIYLNGRYSFQAASSGSTKHWGLIKVDGITGTKIYDRTYGSSSTLSNFNNDGVSCYAYGNNIVLLGNLITGTPSAGTFIKYDAVADSAIYIKTLSNGFQSTSKTLQLENHNDSLLELRKEGSTAYLILYDKLGQQVYRRRLLSSSVVSSGGFGIDGNKVVVAIENIAMSNTLPYYNFSAGIVVTAYEYDFSTGTLVNSSTISPFSFNGPAEIKEIRFLSGKAFIFLNGSSTYFMKWDAGGLSTANTISSNSLTREEGKDNRVYDNDSTLLLFNRRSVVEISDQSNVVTPKATYPGGNTYQFYDMTEINNIIFVVGRNESTNRPCILAYDKLIDSILYLTNYSFNGEFNKVKSLNNDLYVSGSTDTSMFVYSLNSNSGAAYWSVNLDSIPITEGKVYDMGLNAMKGQIAVSGATDVTNTSSNAIVSVVDVIGQLNVTYKLNSVEGLNTYANELVVFQDSGYWFGGSVNRFGFKEEGFLYSLNTKPSLITSVQKSSTFLSQENTIFLYPNPTTNSLNIKGLEEGKFAYRIFDMMGREIKRAKQTSSQIIDVSNFSKGTYLISFQQNLLMHNFTFIKL